MNYQIIENFLPQEEFLNIQQQFNLEINEFPWYFRKNMVEKDNFYFRHVIYNEYVPLSPAFQTIAKPILKKLNCISPITIRANLMIKQEKPFQSEFHVDNELECKTAIFYINTNNGYTLIDKKKRIKIPCEENKILIFNSNIEHAAVSQTDEIRRIVININYI